MSTELIRKRLEQRAGATGIPKSTGEQGGKKTTESPQVDTAEILDRVRQRLAAQVPEDLIRNYRTSSEAKKQLTQLIQRLVREEGAALGRVGVASLTEQLMADLLGYGPIQPLVEDPSVTEIMVNGPEQVWIERGGKLEIAQVRFRDAEHLRQVVERIVAAVGRRIDDSTPLADARLPDGSRVNAVLPPIALDGPYLTIRKFGRRLTAEELVKNGTVAPEVLDFLAACVRARFNIIVSGGTGSGKTTLLNVVSSFIPADERIVTIEDAAELQLQQPHVVRLETRPPNVEGKGAVTIRDLVRNSLRMRPDRIVVGECRGGEALDMLQAMNTGHEGSMSTLHANSPADALRRLEVMVLMAGEELPLRAIREQIASAVDLIVQISRLRDGSRRVVSISQVVGMEDSDLIVQDLFRFEYEGEDDKGRIIGRLVPTGTPLAPYLRERMEARGVALPEAVRTVLGG